MEHKFDYIHQEKEDFVNIFKRIRKKDFSGNSGIVLKNSIYQFSTSFAAKVGSLIYTIILARIFMPELFGLYNLALTTVLIFVILSNLGIDSTVVRFVSRSLEKNKESKTKAYIYYFMKLKIGLVLFSSLLLLVSAKFISNVYYQKPIYLALLVGILYIVFLGATSFLQYLLYASNYFKGIFLGESISQIMRLLIVPSSILIFMKFFFLDQKVLAFAMFCLGFASFISFVFLFFITKKKLKFLSAEKGSLSKKEIKKIWFFFIALSSTALSGLFFSSIDKIMLGRYVAAEFIGYYSATFSLLGTVVSLISFSVVLLPIFSRYGKQKAKNILSKSVRMICFISICASVGILLFANIIINIIYGSYYFLSINMLRAFFPLIILIPLGELYSSYYISQRRTKLVAYSLIGSTILNIILNYFFLVSLASLGPITQVYGVIISTILTKTIYLGILVFWKK